MFMLASLVYCDVPIISVKTRRGRRKVERVISSLLVSLRRNFGSAVIDIFILSLRVCDSFLCLSDPKEIPVSPT